nr:ORF1 [Torque teno felis virus]
MAPYTRRRWRWRRWKPYYRSRRRRAPYKSRRIWKTRRLGKRRTRRRVRKYFHRKRRLVTLFDPVNIAKCKISGATIGLVSQSLNVVNRCYYTVWKDSTITKLLTGGGVTLLTFSLRFLWEEHRHFRNIWSHTNDGFDLALYFGTKVFLQPHRFVDYAFFYDTDLVDEKEWDYIRLHPQQLLGTKNVVFVRSQSFGNNHRTKKVFIKPPSNITTQWKFQHQWFDVPLFQFGFILFNWHEPFLKQDANPVPIVQISGDDVWQWQTSTYKPVPGGFAYSPYIDTAKGNYIDITEGPPSSFTPSTGTQWKKIAWTNDLPYWLTTWGQNQDWNYNVTKTNQSNIFYCRIWWPDYTAADITGGNIGKKTAKEWVFSATQLRKFAGDGPFVYNSLDKRANIPFIYKSYWKWGGTVLKQDQVVAIHPTSGQVSVKNPQTQFRDIIYPFDQSGGLLTERALKRFLEPRGSADERRPLPTQADPPRDACETVSYSAPEETETSEEDEDSEIEVSSAIKSLRRRLFREQSERRRIHEFFKSLLVKKGQHMQE